MSNYDEPAAEDVRQALIDALSTSPLEGFEVVNFNHPEYEAFALVRADGTVWIVATQEGKLVMAR